MPVRPAGRAAGRCIPMFSLTYLIIVVLLLLLLAGSQWWLRRTRGGVRQTPAVRLLERRVLTPHTALLRASCDGRDVWLVESSRQITVLAQVPTVTADVPLTATATAQAPISPVLLAGGA